MSHTDTATMLIDKGADVNAYSLQNEIGQYCKRNSPLVPGEKYLQKWGILTWEKQLMPSVSILMPARKNHEKAFSTPPDFYILLNFNNN